MTARLRSSIASRSLFVKVTTRGRSRLMAGILERAPRRRDRGSRPRGPGARTFPPRRARRPPPPRRAPSRHRAARAFRTSAAGAAARGETGAAKRTRATLGASGAKTASRSLSAIPPKRRSTRPESPSASSQAASARAPSGLCAPSRIHARAPGRTTRCRRPGQRVAARPRAIDSSSSGAIVRAAATASAAFARWCAPASEKTPSHRASGAISASRAPTRAASARRTAAASGGLPAAPTRAGRPLRKVPAFSRATSARVGPSTSRWSAPTFVTTETSGVEDVRRVEPPADPHFHDGNLDARPPEELEGRDGERLEVGRAPVGRSRDGRDEGEGVVERRGRNVGVVDPDPLRDADEVGRRVEARPDAGGPEDRGKGGRGRPLAVGPGDQGGAEGPFRVPERGEKGPRPVEAGADPLRPERVEPAEPAHSPKSLRSVPIVAFSFSRGTTASTNPWSSRNSARWNPSGSVWRIVCSMTRGPGEADQRLRFRQDHVSLHRERGRHASRRRVGQNGKIGHARVAEAGERAGDLPHLHQREDSLLHPRAPRRRDDDQREPLAQGELRRARDHLADDRAHRAPAEGIVENRHDDAPAVEVSGRRDDRVGAPRAGLVLLQPVAVTLRILELQRVDGTHLRVERLPALVVEEESESGIGRKAEVVLAFRADREVPLDFLRVERLAAPLALEEQPLAERRRLLVAHRPRALVLLEPDHGEGGDVTRAGSRARRRGARPVRASPTPRRGRAPRGGAP